MTYEERKERRERICSYVECAICLATGLMGFAIGYIFGFTRMWHFLLGFAAGLGLAAWAWYPGYRAFWDSRKEHSYWDHYEL